VMLRNIIYNAQNQQDLKVLRCAKKSNSPQVNTPLFSIFLFPYDFRER